MPDNPSVIRAKNLTFTYPGASEPVLKDSSLTVRRGQVLAIAGQDGVGKSTLAKLLTGLYTPASGKVTWDDTDLATADLEQVWSRRKVPGNWPSSPGTTRLTGCSISWRRAVGKPTGYPTTCRDTSPITSAPTTAS